MTKMRVGLVGALLFLAAGTAFAQPPTAGAAGGVSTFGGQAIAPGPRAQGPTPLFMLGGLPVVVWTRVSPPYDVTANRSAAANPLP